MPSLGGKRVGKCNYCTLESMRVEAKRQGMQVTLREKSIGTAGHWIKGTDVFVHPKSIHLSARIGPVMRCRYWKAWFHEISEQCVC